MAMKAIRDFVRKLGQKGQGIVEYALILAFVVGVAAVLMSGGDLRKAVEGIFSNTTQQLQNQTNTGTGSGTGTTSGS